MKPIRGLVLHTNPLVVQIKNQKLFLKKDKKFKTGELVFVSFTDGRPKIFHQMKEHSAMGGLLGTDKRYLPLRGSTARRKPSQEIKMASVMKFVFRNGRMGQKAQGPASYFTPASAGSRACTKTQIAIDSGYYNASNTWVDQIMSYPVVIWDGKNSPEGTGRASRLTKASVGQVISGEGYLQNKPGPYWHKGRPLQENGVDIQVFQTTLILVEYELGYESPRQINMEVTNWANPAWRTQFNFFARPQFWNHPGHQDEQLWQQIKKWRREVKYQSGMTEIGRAEVNTPKTAPAPGYSAPPVEAPPQPTGYGAPPVEAPPQPGGYAQPVAPPVTSGGTQPTPGPTGPPM